MSLDDARDLAAVLVFLSEESTRKTSPPDLAVDRVLALQGVGQTLLQIVQEGPLKRARNNVLCQGAGGSFSGL